MKEAHSKNKIHCIGEWPSKPPQRTVFKLQKDYRPDIECNGVNYYRLATLSKMLGVSVNALVARGDEGVLNIQRLRTVGLKRTQRVVSESDLSKFIG